MKNYRQAPRKVRAVADVVRGKSVERALAQLAVLPKRASAPIEKLLRSAVANAKAPARELYVSKVEVGGGTTLKRFMPRARGRASAIKKRTSRITITLSRKAKSEVRSTKSEK